MAKTKQVPPLNLAVEVAVIADNVDRGDLTDALAELVRRSRVAARPMPVPDWQATVESKLYPHQQAAVDMLRSKTTKVRRKPKRLDRWQKVEPLVSGTWQSGLRQGTERWKKLKFVLEQHETLRESLAVRHLLSKEYDSPSGRKIDSHDLNGMVERGHIKIGD